MRSGRFAVVSSALLFLFGTAVPCHSAAFDDDSGTLSGLLIGEFYPCALCSDEYLSVVNTLDQEVCLDGFRLSDQEGSLSFGGGLTVGPKASFSVSFNGSSYHAAFGSVPSLSLDSAPEELVVQTGTFRLADDGDSVALVSPEGLIEDFVVYGECDESDIGWTGPPMPALRRGEVAKRLSRSGCPVDSDTSSDWTSFREFRYGYTEFAPTRCIVEEGGLVAFCSPDCSLEVLLEEVASARTEILACAYELSSSRVTSALLRAVDSGVSVRVMVDGSPAGGMDEDQVQCLSVLAVAGADVCSVVGNADDGIVKHVLAVHSKYLVIDRMRVVAMSENLVEDGFPGDELFGNRGWGVAFTSEGVATMLAGVFEEDSRGSRPDVRSWTDDPRFYPGAILPAAPEPRHTGGQLGPLRWSGPFGVSVFVSPDCSVEGPYLSPLVSAARSVRAEQFQADLLWSDRWTGEERTSPVLEAVLDMMRAGGSSEVLLDSSWFNEERHNATLEYLGSEIREEGLDGECAMLDRASPIGVLHNKGLVLDGSRTVVSSNNWVSASFARNRELAVVIDSPEAGRYFSEVFRMDWVPDTSPPVADVGPDLFIPVGTEVVLTSERCSDDRVVADVWWDLGADGSMDASGPTMPFTGEREGTWVVRMVVRDAWGNEANDTVIMEVSSRSTQPPGGSVLEAAVSRPIWLLPVVACVVVLAARELARRRARRRPRKVNHPGPGFIS